MTEKRKQYIKNKKEIKKCRAKTHCPAVVDIVAGLKREGWQVLPLVLARPDNE